jgi:hypothetical protein
MFACCSRLGVRGVPPFSEPANNRFSLHEWSTAAGVITFPIDNVRFEQFFEIPMEGIRVPLFAHFLQQFAQAVEPFAIELKLDT